MNNILVPLNDISRLSDFISAGADEFYMGFYDDKWNEQLGNYSEINRMSGFGRAANSYNFSEILEIVKQIKDKGKAIFITINSASYNEAEINMLSKYIEALALIGTDGIIVSTPELCTLAKSIGIEAVASTMCGIFNSDIVSFYEKLGVKRIILPRDLTMEEIASIINKNPNISYEVFLMRNGCQFSDSHCLGFHRRNCGSMCGMLNSSKVHIHSLKTDFKSQHDIELNHYLYTDYFHKFAACGLCALYRFVKLGVTSYKIVGRAEHSERIISDIKIVKKNIAIAKDSSSEEEYLKRMIMPSNSSFACKMGFSCYYPEIRF